MSKDSRKCSKANSIMEYLPSLTTVPWLVSLRSSPPAAASYTKPFLQIIDNLTETDRQTDRDRDRVPWAKMKQMKNRTKQNQKNLFVCNCLKKDVKSNEFHVVFNITNKSFVHALTGCASTARKQITEKLWLQTADWKVQGFLVLVFSMDSFVLMASIKVTHKKKSPTWNKKERYSERIVPISSPKSLILQWTGWEWNACSLPLPWFVVKVLIPKSL